MSYVNCMQTMLRFLSACHVEDLNLVNFVDYSFRRYGAPSEGALLVQVTVVCNGPDPAFKELTF